MCKQRVLSGEDKNIEVLAIFFDGSNRNDILFPGINATYYLGKDNVKKRATSSILGSLLPSPNVDTPCPQLCSILPSGSGAHQQLQVNVDEKEEDEDAQAEEGSDATTSG